MPRFASSAMNASSRSRASGDSVSSFASRRCLRGTVHVHVVEADAVHAELRQARRDPRRLLLRREAGGEADVDAPEADPLSRRRRSARPAPPRTPRRRERRGGRRHRRDRGGHRRRHDEGLEVRSGEQRREWKIVSMERTPSPRERDRRIVALSRARSGISSRAPPGSARRRAPRAAPRGRSPAPPLDGQRAVEPDPGARRLPSSSARRSTAPAPSSAGFRAVTATPAGSTQSVQPRAPRSARPARREDGRHERGGARAASRDASASEPARRTGEGVAEGALPSWIAGKFVNQ